MAKPNCYDCIYQGGVAGSVHLSCQHPKSGVNSRGGDAFAMLASVGRGGPVINVDEAASLNIKANPHGIKRGWFNWPYNFDPTWLENCDGFEAKQQPAT